MKCDISEDVSNNYIKSIKLFDISGSSSMNKSNGEKKQMDIEYLDFCKKQWLPKNIRKLGSKLFNIHSRTGSKVVNDTEKFYENLPDEK